jgi:hypothetical protein
MTDEPDKSGKPEERRREMTDGEMKRRVLVLTASLVVALAVLGGWIIRYRYDNSGNLLIRTNRWTGYAETLIDGRWVGPPVLLTASDLSKVRIWTWLHIKEQPGLLGLRSLYMGGGIWNNSEFNIKEVVVEVALKDGNGYVKVRDGEDWKRIISIPVQVNRFDRGNFELDLAWSAQEKVPDYEWAIKAVYGIPRN